MASGLISLMKRRLAILATALASTCPLPARDVAPPLQRVVFVHGIFQPGYWAFGTLRRRLEAQGISCMAPSLHPCDGRDGLEMLAQQLKAEINQRFGPREHFSIVAFSMGGLVSRYYLQELEGAKRCDCFITLATPHHGTTMAWLYGGLGARQMRPGSEFLAQLEQTENRLGKMPVSSFRTPYDLIIVPSTSSVWQRAENAEFAVLAHPLMTRSAAVVAAVEARLFRRAQPMK
jgi:triacylglycerol lipase